MSARDIVISTSVLRAEGRLVVCCEVDYLIPSGLTVPELLDRIRPQLAVAIEDAATRDPLAGSTRAPSVQMDMNGADPGIALWVYSPAEALLDLEGCLKSLQAIVTRFTQSAARQSARKSGRRAT